MGRKPISDEPKDAQLRIRLSTAELEELDGVAGLIPTSTWARDILLRAARGELAVTPVPAAPAKKSSGKK